jgi:hypothetical protein
MCYCAVVAWDGERFIAALCLSWESQKTSLPSLQGILMQNTWILDAIRIYYECGFIFALFFLILSKGEMGIKDLALLVLFWPAPLLIMLFGLKGGDEE